jgi:hypothetical protein
LKKPPQKVAYLWQLEVFFSAAPTAQNSPELHFRFIDSFIQPSLVGSLITGKFKNPNVLGKILLQLQVALAFLLPSYDIHVLAILKLQNLNHQFFETTGLLLQRLLGARVLV